MPNVQIAFAKRYQKTVGSLIMVVAFAGQWYGDERLKPQAEALFSSTSDSISALQVDILELKYLQTKDASSLAEALRTNAGIFNRILRSDAFKGAPDERFQPILTAMEEKPVNFDEYQNDKLSLMSAMGKYWKIDWLAGADRVERTYSYYRLALFLVSLMGMMLIWNGERTTRNAS